MKERKNVETKHFILQSKLSIAGPGEETYKDPRICDAQCKDVKQF